MYTWTIIYIYNKKKSYTNVRLKNACIVQKKNTRGTFFIHIYTYKSKYTNFSFGVYDYM